MPADAVITGFCGKLPARGDFVESGLPHDFVRAWQGWVGSVMAACHSGLGEQMDAAYMTAPLWRFHLAPGVCGTGAAAGLMLPSVDRVGRTFPLMVGAVGGLDFARLVGTEGNAWFGALEALAFDLLELHLEPPEIEQRLAETKELLMAAAEAAAAGDRVVRADLAGLDSPLDGITAASLIGLARAGLPGLSAWWTDGSDLVEPSLLLCRGMLPAERCAALLVGRWQEFGWPAAEELS